VKVYFHILNGTREGQILELEVPAGQTMTIGRDPTCDLAFSLEFEYPVSRQHATLTNKGGRIMLKDVGSSLGTFVQQKKVKVCELKSKYRVQFGEYGPLCRFYKSTDLKKCPLCKGPLFKNNFTCVHCKKKVCSNHFDDGLSCCGVCAEKIRAKGQRKAPPPQAAPIAVRQITGPPPPRPRPAGPPVAPPTAGHLGSESAGMHYGQAPPGYAPGYGPAPPGYGPAPPGYGPTPPGYGPAPPGYAPAPPGYGPAPPGYGHAPPAYPGQPTLPPMPAQPMDAQVRRTEAIGAYGAPSEPPPPPPRGDHKRTAIANAVCENCGMPTRSGERFCKGCR
jgi:hypothetical protein